MRTLIFVIICTGLAIFSANGKEAPAPKNLKIDLAEIDHGNTKKWTAEGKYSGVEILNSFPSEGYNFYIKKERKLLDPLNSNVLGGFNSLDQGDCDIIREEYNKLLNLTRKQNVKDEGKTEQNIKEATENLKKVIKKNTVNETCETKATSLIKQFTRTLNHEFSVGPGETVTIKISRKDFNDGSKTLEWTFILEGPEPGKWVSTIGLGFTSQGLGRRSYVAREGDTQGEYEITESEKSQILDLNYIPAVFFSYVPSKWYGSWLSHSLTAGLGFDLNAPVVFLGYSLHYRHNIGVSAGLVFEQQQRLKDIYTPGQKISMNLDKDALHDKVYRPNFFLAVNFRFSDNPFKKKEAEGGD